MLKDLPVETIEYRLSGRIKMITEGKELFYSYALQDAEISI